MSSQPPIPEVNGMTVTRKALIAEPPEWVWPAYAKNPEINELVLQVVFVLTSILHKGTKIQCELSETELLIDADGKKVSEALNYVLKSVMSKDGYFQNGSVPQKSTIVRTGALPSGDIFVNVCSQYIAADPSNDATCDDATRVAQMISIQNRKRAETILESIGGRLATAALDGHQAQGLTISMKLPRWTQTVHPK